MLITVKPESEAGWELLARGLIKAHMKLGGLKYADLRDRLVEFGVDDTEANLRNKVNRGRFSAIFFLQCLTALEVRHLLLPNGTISGVRVS